jgi:hypothetical protein
MKALSGYTSCMAGLAFFGAFLPTVITGSIGQMLGLGALIFGVLAVAEGEHHGRSALASVLQLTTVTILIWIMMLSLANLQLTPLV